MTTRSNHRWGTLVLVCVLLAAILVVVEPPAARALTLTVNSTADTADANPGNGACADGGGNCTLRAAIQEANASAGTDTINFAIDGAGPHVIAVGPDPLPAIVDPVHINGYSQPGSSTNTAGFGDPTNAVIQIGIDGGAAVNSFSCIVNTRPGLCILNAASGSSVRGLAIHGFGAPGIRIAAGNVVVAGNYIGLDPTGAADGNSEGIAVGALVDTDGNVIGGAAPADRNVISGNTASGVRIEPLAGSVGASGNEIRGNFVGLGPSGTAAAPNGTGINTQGAPGTLIDGNVVSGNTATGILIETGSGGTVITNNRVGTNAAGTAALANSVGVSISSCADGCNPITVGDAGSENVVSGNSRTGVEISSSNGHFVRGNLIGVDASGTAAIPNGTFGITITGSGLTDTLGNDNVVGGSGAGDGNVIAANGADGIRLASADRNRIVGNFIGTGIGLAPLGNTGAGIDIDSGADDNVALSNRIAHNGTQGVVIRGSAARNLVSENLIDGNGALGIDLAGNGVSANDDQDVDGGPNTTQNYTVLTAATASATSAEINGTLNSVPNSSFTIEFFSSPAADPSGHGEGVAFLGSIVVNTDAAGDTAFAAVLGTGVSAGHVVTSTATDASGNTSEFSSAIVPAANRDPTITSDAAPSIPENTTFVIDVESSDPDGDTEGAGLTYALTGGADVALFEIVAATGELSFVAAPDFENPADADGDNDYEVQVTVTDSAGGSDVQEIVVTVTDVFDPPPVEIHIDEQVTVTDDVTVLLPVVILVDENVTVTDDVTVLPPVVIEIDEQVTVTDDVTVLPPVVIEIGEQIIVTDSPLISVLFIVDLDTGDATTLSPGDEVLIEGSGFDDGSEVEIIVLSDPVHLAVTTADNEGRISVPVVIPPDTPPGMHTIVATQVEGGFELSAPVRVVALPGAPNVTVDAAAASAQYSDPIPPVEVTARGFDTRAEVAIVALGLPDSLNVSACDPFGGDGTTCTATIDGLTGVPAGSYPVAVHAIADGLWSEPAHLLVEIVAENASVDGTSPSAGEVVFVADFLVFEAPESPIHPGDIGLAEVTVSATRQQRHAIPVELSCVQAVNGSGLTVSCNTTDLRNDAYVLSVVVDGGYYTGSAAHLLVVAPARIRGMVR